MVYVLCSRLRAQQIPKDKSSKVIHDVVASLFDKKFIFEIQKKQEIAKHLAVRQLFDKLVHSSIMRLNTSSMNKLFDLMLMSVKLQFVKTKFPEEIFQITMNHLNSLIAILEDFNDKENDSLIAAVKESIVYVNKTYLSLSPYEYVILRQTLLRFFQGKNVKVSIFIQDGTQSSSGVIFLPMHETAPPSVKLPGRIVKYTSGGSIFKEYNLELKLSHLYQPSKTTERLNIFTTELGGNIYLADRKSKQENDPLSNNQDPNINSLHKGGSSGSFDIRTSNLSTPNNKNNSTPTSTNTNIFSNNSNPVPFSSESPLNKNFNNANNTNIPSYLEDTEKRKENIEIVKKEFGELASLLNIQAPKEEETFKLDLFKFNRKKQSYSNSNLNDEIEEDNEDFIEIEREKDEKIDKLKGMFDDLDLTVKQSGDDDLLDLMDLAAEN